MGWNSMSTKRVNRITPPRVMTFCTAAPPPYQSTINMRDALEVRVSDSPSGGGSAAAGFEDVIDMLRGHSQHSPAQTWFAERSASASPPQNSYASPSASAAR